MENNPINIRYIYPSPWRKFMARVIDFIVLVFLFACVFVPARAIVSNSTTYQEANTVLESYKIDSGLYKKKSDGSLIDYVSFVTEDSFYSVGQMNNLFKEEIDYFIEFTKQKVGDYAAEIIAVNYKDFRLNENLVFDGQKYFILEDDNVVRNPLCTADENKYYDNVYTQYLDINLNGYLLTLFPEVAESNKTLTNLMVFVEIPISVAISSFITYILPTFIFKRNRYTLGRLAYHISFVGNDCLSVKTKKIVLKNVYLYFGEILLSIVTFGIPLIISFSMSIFTSKKQTFSEYMTGIVEIDSNDNKVYHSKEEIKATIIDASQEPVNFQS